MQVAVTEDGSGDEKNGSVGCPCFPLRVGLNLGAGLAARLYGVAQAGGSGPDQAARSKGL
jgi:hypothetical protein